MHGPFRAAVQYNVGHSPFLPELLLPTVLRWLLYPLVVILGLAAMAVAMAAVVLSMTYPNLPSLEILTDYRPKMPLRVYTADGYLIGEFGEERRAVVSIQDVPAVMKQAILAAEDERFYQHPGVDTQGVLRAAVRQFRRAAASARGHRPSPCRWRATSSFPAKRPDSQTLRERCWLSKSRTI
jgi:membrane peptidoglycan carboxypeptidase